MYKRMLVLIMGKLGMWREEIYGKTTSELLCQYKIALKNKTFKNNNMCVCVCVCVCVYKF